METVMIPVELESDKIQEEFGSCIEQCYFCKTPTRFWHKKTNNPVCKICADRHKVSELPNRFKGQADIPIIDIRPSWDEYFMSMLNQVASRSTCLRRQVGAILVKDKKIIATGYNGAATGLPHCAELGGCLREQLKIPSGERHEICRGVHAEENSIIQCAVHGVSTSGATLYCLLSPCSMCAKSIRNAGIIHIVYPESGHYPSELTEETLVGIKITRM